MVPDAVVTAIREAGGTVTAASLAARLGVHVTTARYHLDRLADAGTVRAHSTKAGVRGRPSLRYALVDPGRAREELIAVLAGAVERSAGPSDAAAAGAAWADGVQVAAGDPIEAVFDQFERLGFEPELTERGIDLRGCPFRNAARSVPGVVCGVHQGLAQRIAERASGQQIELRLEPFVDEHLCRIHVLAPN